MGLKEGFLLRLARRWISGVDLESVMKDAKRANERGLTAVVNYLGEDVADPKMADLQAGEYRKVQQAISDDGVRGYVSVKLTQFGIGSDEAGATGRLRQVAQQASRLGQPLWLDMEGSRFTERTLEIYSRILSEVGSGKVGVALQAYMKRSEADLKRLLEMGGCVRLVKGAYNEPADLVLKTRSEIRKNYIRLMGMLFEQGDNFVIGTHDPKLIEEAKKYAGSSRAKFEFQMLKGIQDNLKVELANSGYRVGEYLPYGEAWYAYSKRRMSEHPSNILLLLRSLL